MKKHRMQSEIINAHKTLSRALAVDHLPEEDRIPLRDALDKLSQELTDARNPQAGDKINFVRKDRTVTGTVLEIYKGYIFASLVESVKSRTIKHPFDVETIYALHRGNIAYTGYPHEKQEMKRAIDGWNKEQSVS